MAILLPNGKQSFEDGAGAPLVGGQLFTYQAGTNVPMATWTDAAGANPNTNPIILDGRGEATVFWLGAYKIVLKDALNNTIWTVDNVSAVNFVSADALAATAPTPGASLVGFKQLGANAVARTVLDKLRDFVTLGDFGVVGDGTDETVKVQNALNYHITSKRPLVIEVAASVTHLDYNGANSTTVLQLAPFNHLVTGGAFDSVLTIRNSAAVSWLGRLGIAGNYDTNLACGIALYTDNATQCSNIYVQDWNISGCQVAVRLSRATEVAALVSEINFHGGNTYGCPIVVAAYGSQTVASFIGGNLLSNSNGGNAGWQAIVGYVVIAYGAWVNVVGGEAQRNADTTGAAFALGAINDPAGQTYGTITVANCAVEAACRLGQMKNFLAAPVPLVGSGALRLSTCRGFHSQDLFSFIEGDVDYTGDVVVDEKCNFYAATARTHSNVTMNGAANVYVADNAFGKNFVPGLGGLAGGNVHFSRRAVLLISNFNGIAMPNGVQIVLKGQALTNNQDTSRFAGNYSTATGLVTVPPGGWRSVEIHAAVRNSQPTQGLVLDCFVNGAFAAEFPYMVGGAGNSGLIAGCLTLGDLAAGATIELRATNQGPLAAVENFGTFGVFRVIAFN